MKIVRRTAYGVLLGIAAVSAAHATNGYQLIGIGAYQKSLGGAITANPGSAMTAVTNPAGMARIGRRADFSMEAFMPERHIDFGAGEQKSSTDMYGVPAIGWTAPVADRDDLYFGGGMYGTSGMGVDYPSTLMMPAAAPGNPAGNDIYWDGYSSIVFWQMAPTLAWKNRDLALGVSLNLDYQAVSFQQRMLADTNSDGAGDAQVFNFDLSRTASGFGYGISLGLLYNVSDSLVVGLAYKSKQIFGDLEYQLAQGDLDFTLQGGGPLPAGTYKLGLDYPQQAAAGLAWSPLARVTLSADVKWINWAQTMDRLSLKGPGGISVPMDPGWSDQTIYAVGLSLAASDRLNLRAGFNYGKSPIDSGSADNNYLLPAIVEQHYTAGADYRLDRHWSLGLHYMYVPENSVRSTQGVKLSLGETSFGFNLGYAF